MAWVEFSCDFRCTANAKSVVHVFSNFFLPSNVQLTESSLTSLKEEKKSLTTKVGELEGTVKKLNHDLEEEREKGETAVGAEGLSSIEVARVLRERNEYKEKYLSLLEQIRYICMSFD